MSTPETTWQDDCHRAAAVFEAGDHQGALDIFNSICSRADVDPTMKAMMYINVATTQEKMGKHDESMKAYDQARVCSLQQYLYVEQSRVVYLIRVGRFNEAITLIEYLLKHDSLTADARAACETNLTIARQNTKAPPVPGATRYSEAPRATL